MIGFPWIGSVTTQSQKGQDSVDAHHDTVTANHFFFFFFFFLCFNGCHKQHTWLQVKKSWSAACDLETRCKYASPIVYRDTDSHDGIAELLDAGEKKNTPSFDCLSLVDIGFFLFFFLQAALA